MTSKLPIGRARFEQDRLRRLSLQQQGQTRAAETVAQYEIQLEEYRNRLVTLIREHPTEIATDRVVRANVRQLAAAVNVQIAAFTTTTNTASSSSGGGGGGESGLDQLALDFMDVISAERKYFGGYVPLSNIISQIARKRHRRAQDRGSSADSTITLEQRRPSHKELEEMIESLRCLGNTALSFVFIDGNEYLQTSRQGTHSADLAALVDKCLREQKKSAAGSSDGGSSVLTTCEGWTRAFLMKEMAWNEKRLEAALRGLLLSGSLWIDTGAADKVERFFLLSEQQQ